MLSLHIKKVQLGNKNLNLSACPLQSELIYNKQITSRINSNNLMFRNKTTKSEC